MWLPFSFAKNLKDRHFVVDRSKNLKHSRNTCFGASFQKNILSSFLLFWSVFYQDDIGDSERNEIASSTARNFNNSWLLCQIFRNNKLLIKYLTERKSKMSPVFAFQIKDAKKDKVFNFLKVSFSVMRVPMDMIFGVFSRTCVKLLTSITSHFFSRYSKSYKNLNVKKCLKLNGP